MENLKALVVEKAKPKDKTYTMADGGGLFLRIYPTGKKVFYFQYLFNKKRKRFNRLRDDVLQQFGYIPQ